MAQAKKDLVIVESPAKARTIEKYLGGDYKVIASMGHLRDLPKSKLGVDIEHGFTPEYIPVAARSDVINELKKRSKEAGTVYLATDPDREGEAISWHLKELLKIPDEKARRVTFNEITKKVVQESIANPRDIDQDLVDAQQARRILDRIVGYKLSPLLWRKVRRGLSAGRVQSVAIRMVVDRETRSGRSSRRNTGIWMRISTAPGRRAALSPAITVRQTRKKSFTVKKKWRTSSPPWKRRRGRSAPSSAASASAARRPRSSPPRCSRRRAAVWGSRRGAR